MQQTRLYLEERLLLLCLLLKLKFACLYQALQALCIAPLNAQRRRQPLPLTLVLFLQDDERGGRHMARTVIIDNFGH